MLQTRTLDDAGDGGGVTTALAFVRRVGDWKIDYYTIL